MVLRLIITMIIISISTTIGAQCSCGGCSTSELEYVDSYCFDPPSGGSITGITCDSGNAQYSIDANTFSTTVPVYNQTTSQTIYYKCDCDGGAVKSITTSPNQIDVWIDLGQSNTVAALGNDYSDSRLPSYSNVMIHNNITTSNQWQPMVYGSNSGEYFNGPRKGHYSIPTLFAGYTDNVYIIKIARGATGLYADSGRLDWNVSSNNELYDITKNEITTALNQLIAQGKNPVVKRVFWNQGEGDTGTQVKADAYESNLTNLINGINSHIGYVPDWQITLLYDDLPDANGYLFEDDIRQAQLNVANNMSFVTTLNVDDCTRPDLIHIDSDCIITKAMGL